MRIGFLHHKYHDLTKSSAFFIEYLSKNNIVIVSSDPKTFIDEQDNLDLIVVWQVLESVRYFTGFTNVILVPMYDAIANETFKYWKDFSKYKFICFSKNVHEYITSIGYESFYLKYYPEVRASINQKNNQVFLWERTPKTSFNVRGITEKFNNSGLNVVSRSFTDYPEDSQSESKADEWLTREAYLSRVEESLVFVAPRNSEGIGMSFLEAMASGCCVYGFNEPTMSEYINNGVNGILVDSLKVPFNYNHSKLHEMGEQARFDCLTGRANYISRLSILNEFIKGAPIQNITARPTRLFLTNILNLSVREVMMFKHRDILGFGKSVIKRIIKKALFITKSTPSPLKPYFIHNQESRRSEFEKIYSESIWGNGSGNGSSLEACVPYMEFLSKFIKDNYIETVVDAGCGDWQFSQHFDWGNVNYLGLDTVRNVIEANRAKYESENIKFAVVDLVDGNLPPSDLLIVKDVLQHLSNESINKIISKFQNYKYVLVVNDIYDSKWLNAQISDGDYRPLDLKLPPFKLSCIKVFEWNASGDPKVVYQFLRN